MLRNRTFTIFSVYFLRKNESNNTNLYPAMDYPNYHRVAKVRI